MKYRVLPPQFELMDSERLCIFQLLDILHLLFVAPELLRDQDLNTPADNINDYRDIKEKMCTAPSCVTETLNSWNELNTKKSKENVKDYLHILKQNLNHLLEEWNFDHLVLQYDSNRHQRW